MTALRSVVGQTGASIILSSSWQGTPGSRAQVDAALQANGIPCCIGQTVEPNAAGAARVGTGEETCASEIKRWAVKHPEQCSGGWVAIDDLDLTRFLPPKSFVRTQAEEGLTQDGAKCAVESLGGPDTSLPPLPPPPQKPGGFNILVTRGEMQRDMIRAAMAGA
eukprot:3768536-Prymnesium_polylepis.1